VRSHETRDPWRADPLRTVKCKRTDPIAPTATTGAMDVPDLILARSAIDR
jgi:hypothetical protein